MPESSRHSARDVTALGVLLCLALGAPPSATPSMAQTPPAGVLTRTGDIGPDGALQVDRGAVGAWQKLLRARTTASVLYTAGHPDDEESGVLTLLSRGMGVRTGLLTLNRGEGGANAIGPELFDALGLIRTEELRLAGRYYGLDDQYFTTAVDYGYSKTLDEAMRSWDRERVLADMVRVIRTNRPLVVVSRWHGSERDGHGHHQAAGVLTPEAVEAAADPSRFPEQIAREGLRPWRVRRVYRGRLQADEPHDLTLDPYRPSPWLGSSYQDFGSFGLSLQRSQTAGRRRAGGATGPPARYERLGRTPVSTDEVPPPVGTPGGAAAPTGPAANADPTGAVSVESTLHPGEHPLFAGLDVSLSGIGRLTGEPLPDPVVAGLSEADAHIERAIADFALADPAAIVPDLVAALQQVREAARALGARPEAHFILSIQERRLADALLAAAGIETSAQAVPAGEPAGTPMGPAVPGQALDVHVRLSPSSVPASPVGVELRSAVPWVPGESVSVEPPDTTRVVEAAADFEPADLDEGATATLPVAVPSDAQPTRPWFHRTDIRMNHYEVLDSSSIELGESSPDLVAVVTIALASAQSGNSALTGTRVDIAVPVHTVEANPPSGSVQRPLTVVPPVSVRVRRPVLIAAPGTSRFDVPVEVSAGGSGGVAASVSLALPDGWRSEPPTHEVTFSGTGQSRTVDFVAVAPDAASADGPVEIHATAQVGDREYRQGYRLIEHRDLFPQRLYEDARLTVEFVDVEVPEGLRVGYVMGVGDEVPQAIEQLGASVTLLSESDLDGADPGGAGLSGAGLGAYDAIVVGTRAYAVRADLIAANDRLLDYARAGGNLVVLYQTPEYRPELQAPFTASLPGNAEEVSEEDAPVRILAPRHPLLQTPNVIGPNDFQGWVEQRGSKFFATWSPEYTALVETHDTGQAPQEGVWLTAPLGDGRFTYVALALHRQLPYGVHGAYRILANLLAGAR